MTETLEVTRYQAAHLSPDAATAETVRLMCSQIAQASTDSLLRLAARDAVRRFRGGPLYVAAGVDPLSNPGAIADSCWWWAKHQLRFQHHEAQIRVWFNERDQLQLLISPDLLLRMQDMRGDCAIYTMLVCGFLNVLGVPWEIQTLAVDPHQPDVYGHVFARAVMPDGRRIPLDASHGKYPGWQVPREHTLRSQVWNEQGQPIEDAARFTGLHAYTPTPELPTLLSLNVPGFNWSRGLRGYRGLGDDGESTTTLDPSVMAPPPITNPSSGFDWGSLLGQQLGAWTTIAGRVIAPTTTVQKGPGGTYSIVTPAGSPTAAASTLATLGGSGGSWLWIAIAAVGGFLLLSARKK